MCAIGRTTVENLAFCLSLSSLFSFFCIRWALISAWVSSYISRIYFSCAIDEQVHKPVSMMLCTSFLTSTYMNAQCPIAILEKTLWEYHGLDNYFTWKCSRFGNNRRSHVTFRHKCISSSLNRSISSTQRESDQQNKEQAFPMTNATTKQEKSKSRSENKNCPKMVKSFKNGNGTCRQ